jgi:hypothetical protein
MKVKGLVIEIQHFDPRARTSRQQEGYKVKNGPIKALVPVIVGLAFCGCAAKAVNTTEWGDLKAAQRVLIATQKSEFKEAVVSRIVEDLEKDLFYVKVIDIKKLRQEPATDYDAVVVINTCKAWRLTGGASKFVKEFPDKDKVVLLTTAGGEDWKPKKVEVDAITSASKEQKADPVAEDIVARVRKILGPDDAE